MHRFRVPPEVLGACDIGSVLTLPTPAAHHALHVLRLKEGAWVACFDGDGHELEGRICSLSPAQVQVEQKRLSLSVSPQLVLGQGLPRGDKLEEILQHGTELGLTALWPLTLERSQVKLEPGKVPSRLLRWEKIAEEASRQCRRADVARIHPPARLEAFLAAFQHPLPAPSQNRPSRRLGLVLYEDGPGTSLATVLERLTVQDCPSDTCPQPLPPELWFLIGPEGGLTRAEVDLAVQAGFERVSLGKRILRTETASLAVLAVFGLLLEEQP